MDAIINDEIFGEMTYKHRWFKMEVLNIFDKEWTVKVVAKAFSRKPISDEQRSAYKWFIDNLVQIDKTMYDVASSYINENARSWNGDRTIETPTELAQIIAPKTILFKQEGEILVLFDCPWDEHGIAVQLKLDIEIGCQDIFL